MIVKLEIIFNNAAFEDGPDQEVARILAELAERIRENAVVPTGVMILRDINGNIAGHAEIIKETE